MQSVDYHAIAPVLILGAAVLAVLIVDAFLPARAKWLAMPLSLLGVVGAFVATMTLIGDEISTFGGHYVVDDFTVLFQGFFLLVAVVVLAMSLRYFREGGFYQGEYYYLLLTAFLGCVLMPASRDLLMLFIALELISAPGFLMSAFRKADVKGNDEIADVLERIGELLEVQGGDRYRVRAYASAARRRARLGKLLTEH